MNDGPLISVIVPCYNQGQFLEQALNSILLQNYTYWECIIVNDGSTDRETEPVALKFAQKDERFIYLKKPNSGVSSARNAAMEMCRGAYIRFLDADDWLDPTVFEKSLAFAAPQTVVLNQLEAFIENKKEFVPYYYQLVKSDLTFNEILLRFGEDFDIPIHCALIAAGLLKDFRFQSRFQVGEDWIMWLHIFRQFPVVFIIDEPLAWYRKWPQSATHQLNNSLKHQFLCIQYIIRHLEIGEEQSSKLNQRIIDKLMSKIKTLEQDYQYLKHSTSFKLGHFIVNIFHSIKKAFNSKQKTTIP